MRILTLIALFIYLLTVLWFTVLKRSTGYHVAQFELFWSYKKWFTGDTDLGNEIMANIAMFIPFGFFLSSTLSSPAQKTGTEHHKRRWSVVAIVVAAILFSLTIETLQLFLMRGLFEWDDVFSNTLGAIVGAVLFLILSKCVGDKRREIIITVISLAFVITCIIVFINGRGGIGVEADTTSRAFCFQIDESNMVDRELRLSGFTFRYDYPTENVSLYLRSTETGKSVKMTTEYGLSRTDVNEYFSCENDYTDTGFTASAEVEANQEYEVMVGWSWSVPLSTGVFVTGSDIHYFPEEEFAAPALDADFVAAGIPRVYRPDYHCWVYQYEGALYWIVDQDFNFEDDGTTYIQYQLWTTQIENLPEKRLAHNNFWDNIGGYFEEYELFGDFGDYHVMRRELPREYSITSIVTGYYKNGEWIWKEYFRPIYEFGGDEQ